MKKVKEITQREQSFRNEGIPKKYWRLFREDLPTDVPYEPVSFRYFKKEKSLQMDKATQQRWLKELLRRWIYVKNKNGDIVKIEKNPLKILISSTPSDDVALEITSRIFLNQRALPTVPFEPKLLMINCARYEVADLVDKKRDEAGFLFPKYEKYDLVAIYNVFHGSEGDRLTKIRDFIQEFNYCPLIVVTGGMEPSDFLKKLGDQFDRAIHFKSELFASVKQV